jgi:predicted glycoside hydrolase/deacetylase ChbG (UPF0249 family)
MTRVIINSDDFGADKEVNEAIKTSFYQKIISSTTALVNYPEGLEDAVQLVKLNQIPQNGIGIHLNLTSGAPILEESKQCGLICENGFFHGKIRNKPKFYINSVDKKMIYNELEAQLNRFTTQFGFKPSHIDGHHHIHTEWAIMRCVTEIAKKNALQKIRITRNLGTEKNYSKKLYKVFFNWKLRQLGFDTTDFFGDFSDIYNNKSDLKNKTTEIMVHAIPSTAADIINDYDNEPLNDKVEKYRLNNNYEMINYSQL